MFNPVSFGALGVIGYFAHPQLSQHNSLNVQLGPSFKSKSKVQGLDQSLTLKCLLTTTTTHHPQQTFERVLGRVEGSYFMYGPI